jgi:mitogen-activated protein kinase kinase kinase
LKALAYLHEQNIIHRDLKCANILINEQLEPKISDFGTAKVVYGKDKDDIARLSASLKGTPFYMAPEVVKRTGHNQSADIWSFGCTIIEMLSGKAPWTLSGAKFS